MKFSEEDGVNFALVVSFPHHQSVGFLAPDVLDQLGRERVGWLLLRRHHHGIVGVLLSGP